MGLLGEGWDDPRSMATMQLAAGLLGGGNFGQALGRGLSGYNDHMNTAQQMAQMKQIRDLQIGEYQRKIKKEDEADARSQAIQAEIKRQFTPVSGVQAIGMDSSGPTVAKANMIGQRQQVDYQRLLAMGVQPELVKALAEAPNLGRSEVTRVEETTDAQGRPVKKQFTKYGDQVGGDLGVWKDQQVINFGGAQYTRDPVTNKLTFLGKNTMTPGESASNALGWANNAVSRERLNFDMGGGTDGGGVAQAALTKRFGKAPVGYRWKDDGSMEFVPGGPADQKAQLQKTGEGTVASVVADLRDKYNILDKDNAVVSQSNRVGTNIGAWLGNSGVGQTLGGMIGTKSQNARDSIAMTRPLLLQAIMKATGMSAKQMDSNAELKMYLATATDPKLGLQANMEALDRIENLYGGGSGSGEKNNQPARTPVRTGTYGGKKVIQYSDGSIENAN